MPFDFKKAGCHVSNMMFKHFEPKTISDSAGVQWESSREVTLDHSCSGCWHYLKGMIYLDLTSRAKIHHLQTISRRSHSTHSNHTVGFIASSTQSPPYSIFFYLSLPAKAFGITIQKQMPFGKSAKPAPSPWIKWVSNGPLGATERRVVSRTDRAGEAFAFLTG